MRTEWNTFKGGVWQWETNAHDFIQKNYTPCDGNDQFLGGPAENITELWDQVMELPKKELGAGGVLDMDTKVISTITSHGPGYLNKDKEAIVGFQTDRPFKRSLQPYSGICMVMKVCRGNGFEVDPEIVDFFTKHRKTHNAGVFDAYTDEMRVCRSSHAITGPLDAYGRGRIIGDYRRIALYGVDALIQEKKEEKDSTRTIMYSDVIREREEFSEQIRALEDLKTLGTIYGLDIPRPAADVKEVIQWTYFGYLVAVKEQDGAAMPLGRTSTFLDIYAERDLREDRYTETQAQEFADHFIMKLRLVKFVRTPEYNDLFSGDLTQVMESIGGIGIDGRHMVTKMSYRYSHILHNLGTTPGLNLTVLWPIRLPEDLKRFCAKASIESPSIQYENDDLMRATYGDDYAIACCVSSMRVGREMQLFGARTSPVKCLLYVINGGMDEITGKQVGPKYRPITSEHLAFDEVMGKCKDTMKWLAKVYVNVLNITHHNHDKYSHEGLQMALHDKKVVRWFATGIAGLSVVVDSLSAVKYAKAKTVRNEKGIVTDHIVEGDLPKYGNSDDHVDQLVAGLVYIFMSYIKGNHTYRDGIPTASTLIITSNMAHGKNTGSTPDGHKSGQSFAPGANPMHHRDGHGAVTFLASVVKLLFGDAQDGVSNTFSIILGALGEDDQISMGDLEVELSSCPNCGMGGSLFEGLDFESDIEGSRSMNCFIRKGGQILW